MKSIGAVVAFGFVSTACSMSGASIQIVKYPAWRVLGPYQPVEPKSLADVPEPIRTNVVEHLRDRLGDEFFERLRFSGGQVIDLADLYAQLPSSRNFEWEVPEYNLHFEFSLPEAGIASYTAGIDLRSDGSVVNEIDLPSFRISPDKQHFFSLSDAISIAKRQGFQRHRMSVGLDYSAGVDSIYWYFRELVGDDGHRGPYKELRVSAHSGEILEATCSWPDRTPSCD